MATSEQSSGNEWAPFRVEPQFVERVWGYRDLRPWFDRIAEGEPIGEVWLSGDQCLAANGAHTDQGLGAIFHDAPEAMLGAGAADSESPILIKVLFAQQKLSVQVHPDDKMARKYGDPRGKTECWYALAARPGAQVALGLRPGVTLDQIKAEIQSNTLEQSLQALDITAGDMVYVDAGTVHAIWPGSILLETQQNCDLTYRLYDYGRGRELHIEKSLEAIRLVTSAGKVPPKPLADRTILVEGGYFRVERMHPSGSWLSGSLAGEDETEPGFSYLFAAAGAAWIKGPGVEEFEVHAMGLVAVPAASPAFMVENVGGLDLIRIVPCWPKGNL